MDPIQKVIDDVARRFGVEHESLLVSRDHDICALKHYAMYLARQRTKATHKELGEAFGCHYSNTINAVAKVKKKAKAGQLEAWLQRMGWRG